MSASSAHSDAAPRNLPDWLSDPRLPSADRHRLLRELGRWIWRQQEKRAVLPASAYWLTARAPLAANSEWQFADKPVNPAPDTPSVLSLPLVPKRKPSEQLRSLARSLAYTPLSAGDVLRFMNGYLAQVEASTPEQRTLITVEYPWLERWISALKHHRLSALPWPEDCPKPGQLQFHINIRSRDRHCVQVDFSRPDCPLALEQLARSPDGEGELLNKPGLETGRIRQRLRGLLLSDPEGLVYAKWYINTAKVLFYNAQHELHQLLRAINSGIPAAEPVACLETVVQKPTQRTAVLLTRAIPGEAFDRWVLAGTNLTPDQRHRLARHLGLLLGHLHAAGVYHRDAYLCHIFVSQNPDGQMALRLIDLARALFRPWWPRRWAIKDLAAMYYSSQNLPGVTSADRLRVLHFYLLGSNEIDFGKKARRRWIARILAKAERIARHDRRRRVNVG